MHSCGQSHRRIEEATECNERAWIRFVEVAIKRKNYQLAIQKQDKDP
jgi:hypothetical protein